MELTRSWERVFPPEITERYEIAETRDAAALIQATNPSEFDDIVTVLSGFSFNTGRIVIKGGSKHPISRELDEAFRRLGWREARFDQSLTTRLVMRRYAAAGEQGSRTRETVNEYGGHLIDNVKGRVGLDVEWNPKDGNLDRDLGNFRALYEGGQLNVGIILTRQGQPMRDLWSPTIARAKELVGAGAEDGLWQERVEQVAEDPLKTSTTSNMSKLVPRIERGDGGGCPMLAIAITPACYEAPDDLDEELRRLAAATDAGVPERTLSERLDLPIRVAPEFDHNQEEGNE